MTVLCLSREGWGRLDRRMERERRKECGEEGESVREKECKRSPAARGGILNLNSS